MKLLAVALLFLGTQRHLLYDLMVYDRALWWNLCGSIAIMGLLLIIWLQSGISLKSYRSLPNFAVMLVLLWFFYEELLVLTCSVWRISDWWPVGKFENQCTAQMGTRAASFGILLIGAAIAAISARSESD